MAWDAEGLWQTLEPLAPGLSVEVLARVESTNSTLLERIRAGDSAPCLLVAEEQTRGRGRSGRSWQSVPGASLTFSLALPIRAADWSGLSLAVGLAVAEALDPCPPGELPHIGLKWPNDLMLSASGQAGFVHAHKLGGILIESLPVAGQRMAVIGIGINIAPQLDSPDAAGLSQGYAGLQSLHPGLDAAGTLARVARPLLVAVQAFERDGFAPLRECFASRDVLAGRPVTTTLPDLPAGTADGVDADGALGLNVDGRRHRVASGEVSVRPAAESLPRPKEKSAC